MTWSPNCSGKLLNPKYIIVHYTASGNFATTKDWLCNKSSKVSAHYLVGRDGEQAQLVPHNKIAWHAGESKYKGLTGLNAYSLGIELVSWGPLELRSDGEFYAKVSGRKVPQDEVHDGAPPEGGARYWQKYTDRQLAALRTLVAELRYTYQSILEVIGHRDVAGHRGKQDPWPLNPRSL